jgi:hypothetical protein
MPTNAYDDILKRARAELSVEEQLKLIKELHASPSKGQHSILELEGLGKEVWEGIDPDEYIREERDSWDG